MAIRALTAPGAKVIQFRIDPRTALDVFFALCAAQHAEETTRQQRLTVVGILPQLQRALVESGVVSAPVLHAFRQELLKKPAPPPLDDAIKSFLGQS
jgi:hypothetical protein